MVNLRPFVFENFEENDKVPVLDLKLNRCANANKNENILEEIAHKLSRLLCDRNKENLEFVQKILSDISPFLAEKFGSEIVCDYVNTRFPLLKNYKMLDFYFHPDNLQNICQQLENLAVQYGFEGRIRLHPDPNMQLDGCRINWGDDEENYSTAQILDKIREQLDGVMKDGN